MNELNSMKWKVSLLIMICNLLVTTEINDGLEVYSKKRIFIF